MNIKHSILFYFEYLDISSVKWADTQNNEQ